MKKPKQYIVIDDDQTSNLITSFLIEKFDPGSAVVLFDVPGVALRNFIDRKEELLRDRKTVVFLDLNMPLMSGWDFLDELSRKNPAILLQLEIYILSSSIEDFSEQRKKYPFLAGFLSKPLSKIHLQEIEEKDRKMHSGEEVSRS